MSLRVWTKIKAFNTKKYHGNTREILFPLMYRGQYSYSRERLPVITNNNEPSYKEKSDIFSQIKEETIACAIMSSASFEKCSWEDLENGVVLALNRNELLASNKEIVESTVRSYNAKNNKNVQEFLSDDLIVVVIPINAMALIARFKLHTNNYATDLRRLFFYGFISGVDLGKTKEYWDKAEKGLWKQFTNKEHNKSRYYNPVVDPLTKLYEPIIIFKGKRLTADNVCKAVCPNKIKYGLGRCKLLGYNCTASIDISPDMLVAPKPQFERVFSADKKRTPKECIVRDDFMPYLAEGLVANTDIVQQDLDVISDRAKKANKSKRLKKHLCGSCVFKPDDMSAWQGNIMPCNQTPHSCTGPFVADDIKRRINKLDPWEYHVLFLNKAWFPRKLALEALPILKDRKCKYMSIVGPTNELHVGDWEKREKDDSTSKEAKTADRLVKIRTATRRWDGGGMCNITYEEMCKFLGVSAIESEAELIDRYPEYLNITDEVHFVTYDFIRPTQNNMSKHYQTFNWAFTWSPNAVYCFDNGYYTSTAELQEGYASNAHIAKQLRDSQSTEEKKLRWKLKDVVSHPKVNVSLPVISILAKLSSDGFGKTVDSLIPQETKAKRKVKKVKQSV